LIENLAPSGFSLLITTTNVSSAELANLETVKGYLVGGYRKLQQQNAATLACSVDFGDWLNVAFDLFELQKIDRRECGTWKDWLQNNVGICDRYARDLKAMSKLLENYPKFRKLAIPFSDLLQHKKRLELMLKTDRDFAAFWAQP